MKHLLSSFALSLGLVMPLLAACGAATADDDGNTDAVDSEVRSGKKQACASIGGSCVGLSPSSCNGGHFADASKVSCGPGLGVACCVSCPALSPPAPGFCSGGEVVPRTDPITGCTTGFDCVTPPPPPECPVLSPPAPGFCYGGEIVPKKDATTGCTTGFDCVMPPPPPDCPFVSPPAPGFCSGGTVVQRKDPKTGCSTGYDCIVPPPNACVAAGGTCVGLSPSSCPSGNWGDASTHSCGGIGIGVGCCLP